MIWSGKLEKKVLNLSVCLSSRSEPRGNRGDSTQMKQNPNGPETNKNNDCDDYMIICVFGGSGEGTIVEDVGV